VGSATVEASRAGAPVVPVVPMIFDGYYGGFVPVEAASFDVSLLREAIVSLPLSILAEQCAAAEVEVRRQRRADARRAPAL
jgi:hypothetical protein